MATEKSGSPQRFLLTSLGVSPYSPACYEFERRRHRTRYAPAATARLLGLDGGVALVLLTDEARKSEHWSNLEEELRAIGLQSEVIEISDRAEREGTFLLLDRIARRIGSGSRLTLDVTYGLRHLPFVYNSALAFLTGLADVEIEKIVYGAWELRASGEPDPVVPIVDITHSYALIKWFHALSVFRETGDGRSLARSLVADVGELFRRSKGEPQLASVRNAVSGLTRELAAGLPLEAGAGAFKLNKAFEALIAAGTGEVPSNLAAELIHRETRGIAASVSRKDEIVLDGRELDRQLDLASWYATRDETGKAFAILREWMVNARLFARHDVAAWLERKSRESAERFFGSLFYRRGAGLLLEESQKRAASLWESISQQRNALQHAGMTGAGIGATAERAHQCVAECRALMESGFAGLDSAIGAGRLLISPFGKSPGVLYTGIRTVEPTALLIITSADALPLVEPALDAASWSGAQTMIRQVKDPFAGFNEADLLVDAEVIAALSQAGEIFINLTGGTTVMQWVVEGMARKAQRLGFSVCRIALIDRRTYEEQQREPYVAGSMIRLDADDAQ